MASRIDDTLAGEKRYGEGETGRLSNENIEGGADKTSEYNRYMMRAIAIFKRNGLNEDLMKEKIMRKLLELKNENKLHIYAKNPLALLAADSAIENDEEDEEDEKGEKGEKGEKEKNKSKLSKSIESTMGEYIKKNSTSDKISKFDVYRYVVYLQNK